MVGNCRGSDRNFIEKKFLSKKSIFCFFSLSTGAGHGLQKRHFLAYKHDMGSCSSPLISLAKGSQQHNLMLLQADANQRSEKLI